MEINSFAQYNTGFVYKNIMHEGFRDVNEK